MLRGNPGGSLVSGNASVLSNASEKFEAALLPHGANGAMPSLAPGSGNPQPQPLALAASPAPATPTTVNTPADKRKREEAGVAAPSQTQASQSMTVPQQEHSVEVKGIEFVSGMEPGADGVVKRTFSFKIGLWVPSLNMGGAGAVKLTFGPNPQSEPARTEGLAQTPHVSSASEPLTAQAYSPTIASDGTRADLNAPKTAEEIVEETDSSAQAESLGQTPAVSPPEQPSEENAVPKTTEQTALKIFNSTVSETKADFWRSISKFGLNFSAVWKLSDGLKPSIGFGMDFQRGKAPNFVVVGGLKQDNLALDKSSVGHKGPFRKTVSGLWRAFWSGVDQRSFKAFSDGVAKAVSKNESSFGSDYGYGYAAVNVTAKTTIDQLAEAAPETAAASHPAALPIGLAAGWGAGLWIGGVTERHLGDSLNPTQKKVVVNAVGGLSGVAAGASAQLFVQNAPAIVEGLEKYKRTAPVMEALAPVAKPVADGIKGVANTAVGRWVGGAVSWVAQTMIWRPVASLLAGGVAALADGKDATKLFLKGENDEGWKSVYKGTIRFTLTSGLTALGLCVGPLTAVGGGVLGSYAADKIIQWARW